MESENRRGTAYLRLGVAVICTAFFGFSLVNFQRDSWRENIVAFVIGLLAGYYYTSAWYEARLISKKNEEGKRRV